MYIRTNTRTQHEPPASINLNITANTTVPPTSPGPFANLRRSRTWVCIRSSESDGGVVDFGYEWWWCRSRSRRKRQQHMEKESLNSMSSL